MVVVAGRLPERSTPSMPAAYDLNHSKYTVQKLTNEWEKIRITILLRNNGNKKAKKNKKKPSATIT